jgi:transposase
VQAIKRFVQKLHGYLKNYFKRKKRKGNCALFSNQFTANYGLMPEFRFLKTMLISYHLLE